MNHDLLRSAQTRVPSIPVLINMVSKRVNQLNSGMRPYIKPAHPDEDRMDTALREIAEGKIIAEIDFESAALPVSTPLEPAL